MTKREREITRALKAYDRELFCKKDLDVYVIYRRATSYDLFDFHGTKLWVTRPFNHVIMGLTEDWQVNGIPCEWGIEPILSRVRAMDVWQNDKLVEEFIAGHEKHEETKKRDFRNNVESFMYEFRNQFALATKDINTSALEKIDKRRLQDGTR